MEYIKIDSTTARRIEQVETIVTMEELSREEQRYIYELDRVNSEIIRINAAILKVQKEIVDFNKVTKDLKEVE